MKILFEMFFAFLRIGLFTFGGGYAMLPLLERVLVKEKGWVSNDELMDFYAVGQCTPGVIAVNTATFIGYKKRGVSGAVFATLGIIFPSIIIISIIAYFINQFADYEIVRRSFLGIRVAVCALVTVSVFRLATKAVKDIAAFAVLGLVFALALIGCSPVILVVLSGIAGAVISAVKVKVRP